MSRTLTDPSSKVKSTETARAVWTGHRWGWVAKGQKCGVLRRLFASFEAAEAEASALDVLIDLKESAALAAFTLASHGVRQAEFASNAAPTGFDPDETPGWSFWYVTDFDGTAYVVALNEHDYLPLETFRNFGHALNAVVEIEAKPQGRGWPT